MEGILKIKTLTSSSVYTTHLQLQNVKYVLQVFNEKVVAALQLEGKSDTAAFNEQVLKWWEMSIEKVSLAMLKIEYTAAMSEVTAVTAIAKHLYGKHYYRKKLKLQNFFSLMYQVLLLQKKNQPEPIWILL